jgi:hypothetical protein
MDLIPVKKSTLATWCREVELTTEQIEAIRQRRAQEPGIPRNTQRKRHQEIELIRAQASLEAEHLVADPEWTTGVALYWGEGSKATRQLSMANSDPALLRTFMSWSVHYLPPDTGWRAKLNVHADNSELKPGSGGPANWESISATSPSRSSSRRARGIARTISPMASAS